MTLKRPLFMQPVAGDPDIPYSGLDSRALLTRLFHQEGIVSPDAVFGALRVSQRGAGANMSVDVAPGACVIQGDDVTGQGMYLCECDAVVNVPVPAPPASGTRTHRVIARVRDKLHNPAWTTYDWTIELLPDTGTGTPAIPPSALALGRVPVSAGQSSITSVLDDRFDAGLISSKPDLVSSDTGRPPNPWDGQLITRTDRGLLELAIGGSWYEIPRRDGGGVDWTPYSPVLTAATTNPTLGAGSALAGSYYKLGRSCDFELQLTVGSGWAGGTGQYSFSLPFPAAASGRAQFVSCKLFDSTAGGSQHWLGIGSIASGGTTASLLVPIGTADGSLRGVSNNQPFTWATSDTINVWGTYRTAS
ncbi:hypothetical protein [Actinomadura harenae]|uniref:Uncharacterized protein n=1 Tax=Actinomadura harenae TaxID=2483351 RepID=A0A3M2LQV5_9ACTN|nr:hypothetical protein [Actinomadura harenae]RMI39871.1 hypothetical protein EBO15_28300 [Actinomadura harenae]